VHIFTVGRELALEVGLLKRPSRKILSSHSPNSNPDVGPRRAGTRQVQSSGLSPNAYQRTEDHRQMGIV
jgi:hypothetical protein